LAAPGEPRLFVYLYRGVGTHLGAQTTARALTVAMEFGGMVSLGIDLSANDDAVLLASLNTKAAALAPLLQDHDISF
jgi:hypothetical protein